MARQVISLYILLILWSQFTMEKCLLGAISFSTKVKKSVTVSVGERAKESTFKNYSNFFKRKIVKILVRQQQQQLAANFSAVLFIFEPGCAQYSSTNKGFNKTGI